MKIYYNLLCLIPDTSGMSSGDPHYRAVDLIGIEAGGNLRKISNKAIVGCKNLKTIKLKGKKMVTIGKKAITGTKKKITLKVNKSLVKKYKNQFKKNKLTKKFAVKKI